MLDQGELIGIFSNLISEQTPVTMYNTYRGLPFSYDADILAVEHGNVTSRVHRHQAVCMALEGRTHIHSSALPEIIRASVVQVEMKKKRAVLGEFTGVGDTIGKRTSVRVQPNEPLEAEIYDARRRIESRISDISTTGIGLFIFDNYLYLLSYGNDREVYIDLKLPGTDTVVRFLGVISNISVQEGLYLHRMGMKIFPSPVIKPLLEAYVASRQKEILQEIELTYRTMSQEDSKQG